MGKEKIWEDFIALNSQDEPVFDVLPPPEGIEDKSNWSVHLDGVSNEMVADFARSDVCSIPSTADREGYYGDRHFEYWLSGLQLASAIMDRAREYGSGFDSYAEIGAATGRVVRHLGYQNAFRDIWAFDLNWRHIVWMQRYLQKNIIPVQNSSIPSLPLPDASVDAFSAWSVFSHIEVFEMQWMAEIRRILKPSGIALLSVVTENQISKMDESWPMYAPLTSHPRWSPDFLDELQKHGKIVLRWHNDRSYGSNVVYSTAYLKDTLSRIFEILEYKEQYPDYQDMVVLRRKT